jgi:hypothetical protein
MSQTKAMAIEGNAFYAEYYECVCGIKAYWSSKSDKVRWYLNRKPDYKKAWQRLRRNINKVHNAEYSNYGLRSTEYYYQYNHLPETMDEILKKCK